MKLLARLALCVYCLAITGLVMLVMFGGAVLMMWQRSVVHWLEHSWSHSGELLNDLEALRRDRLPKA